MIHFKGAGQIANGKSIFFWDIDVQNLTTFLAVKMPVLAHVRAKTNGSAIQDHLPNQTAFHEHAEAVVNGREGDFGVRLLGSLEDEFGGWVVVALGNYVEHLLALTRHAQAAGGELLCKILVFVKRHSPKGMQDVTSPGQPLSNNVA